MAKKRYYYEIHFGDGEIMDSRDNDEFFDDEDEADEAALYALSCANVGAELLHLSNPGDYPDSDGHTDDAEIIICEE